MRLDPKLLNTIHAASEVVPGNIYPAQGGRKTPGTTYWLVIATSEHGAHMIGFDADGKPVSTTSYGKHALRQRPLLGRVNVDWEIPNKALANGLGVEEES